MSHNYILYNCILYDFILYTYISTKAFGTIGAKLQFLNKASSFVEFKYNGQNA